MNFDKSVIELIKIRKSTRSFANIDIDEAAYQRLKDELEKINAAAKIKARFVLVYTKAILIKNQRSSGLMVLYQAQNPLLWGLWIKRKRMYLSLAIYLKRLSLKPQISESKLVG